MKNKVIKTKFSEISKDSRTYVIAEIGSNHNGSFDLACEHIEKAAEAGVNAVKFQTFKADSHYSKKTPKISQYNENIHDLIKKLEIDRTWHKKLAKLCENKKIDFLDSPCDFEAIQLAVDVDMPILKVASFDMVDSRLIQKVASTKRAVMFSTGMANLSEIQGAINICRSEGNDDIIVLQCTSLYPAPVKLSNLNAIENMRRIFNVITGYSDHTLGDHIACAAVAMGAKVIEKHYTLNRNLEGPDHSFAIEPHELKDMMSKIRDIELALGNGEKNGPSVEEMEFYKKVRRSVIASRDIPKGTIIKDEDLVIKRPGLGIHPSQLPLIIGRRAQEDILVDEPVTWDKI